MSSDLHLSCRRGLCAQWAGRNPPLAHPSDTFKRSLTPAQRRTLAPLRLRAIRLEAPDGTVSVLLTNLVDLRRFPRAAIIALYWRRWAVETHYRDEKTLQHIEQFHSHTPTASVRNSSPS